MAQAIPQPESMTGRQPRLTYFGCKIIAGILKIKGILCISAGKMKAFDVLISHPTRAEQSCHFNTHLPGMSYMLTENTFSQHLALSQSLHPLLEWIELSLLS